MSVAKRKPKWLAPSEAHLVKSSKLNNKIHCFVIALNTYSRSIQHPLSASSKTVTNTVVKVLLGWVVRVRVRSQFGLK